MSCREQAGSEPLARAWRRPLFAAQMADVGTVRRKAQATCRSAAAFRQPERAQARAAEPGPRRAGSQAACRSRAGDSSGREPLMDSSIPPANQPLPPSRRWLVLAEKLAVCARDIQRLAPLPGQMRLQEALVLVFCDRPGREGTPQAELCARLAASPPQVSQLLERLRGRGWLEAYRRPADRRAQHWRLTTLGERILAEVDRCLQPWVSELERRCPGWRAHRLIAELEELKQAVEAGTLLEKQPPDQHADSRSAPPPKPEHPSGSHLPCPAPKRGAA